MRVGANRLWVIGLLLVAPVIVALLLHCQRKSHESAAFTPAQPPCVPKTEHVSLRDEDNDLRLTMDFEDGNLRTEQSFTVTISLQNLVDRERCTYPIRLIPNLFDLTRDPPGPRARFPREVIPDGKPSWTRALGCESPPDGPELGEGTRNICGGFGEENALALELYQATTKEEARFAVESWAGVGFRFIDSEAITRLMPNGTQTCKVEVTMHEPGEYWVTCGVVSAPAMYTDDFRAGRAATAKRQNEIFWDERPYESTPPPEIWYGILFVSKKITVKDKDGNTVSKTSPLSRKPPDLKVNQTEQACKPILKKELEAFDEDSGLRLSLSTEISKFPLDKPFNVSLTVENSTEKSLVFYWCDLPPFVNNAEHPVIYADMPQAAPGEPTPLIPQDILTGKAEGIEKRISGQWTGAPLGLENCRTKKEVGNVIDRFRLWRYRYYLDRRATLVEPSSSKTITKTISLSELGFKESGKYYLTYAMVNLPEFRLGERASDLPNRFAGVEMWHGTLFVRLDIEAGEQKEASPPRK